MTLACGSARCSASIRLWLTGAEPMRTNSTLARSVRAISSCSRSIIAIIGGTAVSQVQRNCADRRDIGGRRELRQQHDGRVRRAGELATARAHSCDRAAPRRGNGGAARSCAVRAASPPPRYGSGATAPRPWAARSSPTCRGTWRARRAARRPPANGPGSRKSAKAVRAVAAISNEPRQACPAGSAPRRGGSQNTSLAPASRRMKSMVAARKPVIDRHRDEARRA